MELLGGLKLYVSRLGANAYKASKTFKLGFHKFKCGNDLVLRLCYLRTRKHTYYMEADLPWYPIIADKKGEVNEPNTKRD